MNEAAEQAEPPSPVEPPSTQSPFERMGLEEQVIDALRQVYDPEIPINVYDLGLIYKIDISDTDGGHNVAIDMTLTSANCPMAHMIQVMVYDKLVEIPDLHDIKIRLVFDPPWNKSRLSDEASLALDIM